MIQPEGPQDYPHIELAHEDVWGVLMRKDSPLAEHTTIRAADLEGLPLIASRQALTARELSLWFDKDESETQYHRHVHLDLQRLSLGRGRRRLRAVPGPPHPTPERRKSHIPAVRTPKHLPHLLYLEKNQLFSEAARLLKEKVMELSET